MTDKEIIQLHSIYKMYNEKEYNFDALNNQKIFLSRPSSFNDPFDCFVAIDEKKFIALFMAKKLEQIGVANDLVVEVKGGNFSKIRYLDICRQTTLSNKEIELYTELKWEEVEKIHFTEWENEAKSLLAAYRNEINNIRNTFYIACFTKNKPNANMVMWSHYANNYKGLCAEFDFGNIKYDIGKARIDKRGYLILKNMKTVQYSEKFVTINTELLFNTPIDELGKNKNIIKSIKKSLYKKHKQWKYEQEIRVVLTEKELKVIGGYEHLNDGCLLTFPYLCKLFIHKKIDFYTIKPAVEQLAKKLDVKYLTLKDSNGAIAFEEADEINEHNIAIDMRNIVGVNNINNLDFPDM